MADLCLVFLRSLHIVKYRNALKIFRGKGALLVPTDKKKIEERFISASGFTSLVHGWILDQQ
jgi:hypothetical protein